METPDLSVSEYVEGYDQSNSNPSAWFLPTSERYYCLHSKGFLFFWEEEALEWLPLCGNAQCLHEDETCSSYIGQTFLLGQMGDKLVYGLYPRVTDQYRIYRIYSCDMDGSNRKMLKEIEGRDGISVNGSLHRGKVYYYFYENNENNVQIFVEDLLKTKENPELIYEGTGIPFFSGIGTVMNMLIIDVDGVSLFQYDSITKLLSRVDTNAFSGVRTVRFCKDGSIMYAKENKMHLLWLDSGTDQVIGEIDGTSFYADDELLYVSGITETSGYVYEFATGKTLEFSSPTGDAMRIGTDDEYVFAWNPESGQFPEWYLKKEDLMNGNCIWTEIEIAGEEEGENGT